MLESFEAFTCHVDMVLCKSHECVPVWAKLMMTCMRGMIQELKHFYNISLTDLSLNNNIDDCEDMLDIEDQHQKGSYFITLVPNLVSIIDPFNCKKFLIDALWRIL